jgi:hypothetical protein
VRNPFLGDGDADPTRKSRERMIVELDSHCALPR